MKYSVKKFKFHLRLLLLTWLLTSAFLSLSVQAQTQSGAAFLKVLPGARQQGLAGSLTGAIDETYALYSNPGAAGFLREWQWSASYTEWIADIFNASLIYGRQFNIRSPWSNRANIALGIHYQGIREFDSSRGAAAPASAQDILLTASFGSPLTVLTDKLSAGVNVKYFRSELAQFNANALAFDLGLLYRTPRFRISRPGGFFDYGILSAGVALNHLGTSLKFQNSSTPLPKTLRAGIAVNFGTHDGLQIQLTTDYQNIRDQESRFSFGAEIANLFSPFSQGLGRFLDLRGGYNFDNNLLSKLSMGLSIRLDDYMLEPVKGIAPRNSSLRVDMSVLESNEFFAPVYRGSVTHQPILPEKFNFISIPQQRFAANDAIELSWQQTVDPDLYDEVGYIVLVADDSLALAKLINGAKKDELNIFKHIDVRVLATNGHSNGINRLRSLEDDGEENSGYIVVVDSLKNESKSPQEITYTLLTDLAPGHYFWTAMAYDKNRHIRFAQNASSHMNSFWVKYDVYTREPQKPDLTVTISKVEKSILPQPLEMTLPPIVFAPDSANMDHAGRKILMQWVEFIKKHPNVSFEISGHTDITGPPPPSYRKVYNQLLSLRRAKNILLALLQHGIDDSRLEAVGYGDTKPLDPLNTPQSWARNRRVELSILEDNRPAKKVNMANIIYSNQGEKPSMNFAITIFNAKEIPDALYRDLISGKYQSLNGKNGHDFSNILKEVKSVEIDQLDPGARSTIEIPCDEDRPYIIAVIDKDNQVEETDESNNWKAERMVIPKPEVDLSLVTSPKINFKFDSYKLTAQTKELLNELSRILLEVPDERFEISGHTDARGSEEYNIWLSLLRAQSVKDYLISKGIKPKHLVAQGYGEAYPLDKGYNAKAWAKNRRVEIKVIKE